MEPIVSILLLGNQSLLPQTLFLHILCYPHAQEHTRNDKYQGVIFDDRRIGKLINDDQNDGHNYNPKCR